MDSYGYVVLFGERAIAHAKLGKVEEMEEDLLQVDKRRIQFSTRSDTYERMVRYAVIAKAYGKGLTQAISELDSEELDSEDARYLLGNVSSFEVRLWNMLADIAVRTNDPRKSELQQRAITILGTMALDFDLDTDEILTDPDLDSLRTHPEFIYWMWGRSDGTTVDIKDRIAFRRKINALMVLIEKKEWGVLRDLAKQDSSIVSFLNTELEYRPANDITDYRRALAVVGLLKLDAKPWAALWQSSPSERTLFYLLEMLQRFEIPAAEIAGLHSTLNSDEQLAWSLLALANYPPQSFELSIRNQIVNQARESLSNAQKPASVCAAATRLLANWNSAETLLPKPMLVKINVPPKASETGGSIAFQMSSTEVTAYQFAQFRGATMDGQDGNLPAHSLTLSDASQYCNWLSQIDGLAEDQWCYQQSTESASWFLKPNAMELHGYRMPTRNEFEVAAQYSALDKEPTTTLIEAIAWTKGNASFQAKPVARKLPNAQGLFDLLGNVEEWVHVLPDKTLSEGSEEELQGLAGGAVWLETKYRSSSYNRRERSDLKSPFVGFRVVRSVQLDAEKSIGN